MQSSKLSSKIPCFLKGFFNQPSPVVTNIGTSLPSLSQFVTLPHIFFRWSAAFHVGRVPQTVPTAIGFSVEIAAGGGDYTQIDLRHPKLLGHDVEHALLDLEGTGHA